MSEHSDKGSKMERKRHAGKSVIKLLVREQLSNGDVAACHLWFMING